MDTDLMKSLGDVAAFALGMGVAVLAWSKGTRYLAEMATPSITGDAETDEFLWSDEGFALTDEEYQRVRDWRDDPWIAGPRHALMQVRIEQLERENGMEDQA